MIKRILKRRPVWMSATCVAMLAWVMLAGCSTSTPGVTNELGTIQATFGAAPPAVTDATATTLRNMDLTVDRKDATDIDGIVVARTAQDREVTVKINRAGDQMSRVSMRIGLFGDEQASIAVLDRIRRQLGVEKFGVAVQTPEESPDE